MGVHLTSYFSSVTRTAPRFRVLEKCSQALIVPKNGKIEGSLTLLKRANALVPRILRLESQSLHM